MRKIFNFLVALILLSSCTSAKYQTETLEEVIDKIKKPSVVQDNVKIDEIKVTEEKLETKTTNKKYSKINTNHVYIFEYGLVKDDIEKIKKKNIDINYHGYQGTEKGLENSHAASVIGSFFDFDYDANLDGDKKNKDLTLLDSSEIYFRDDAKGIISMSYGHTSFYNQYMKYLNDSAKYYHRNNIRFANFDHYEFFDNFSNLVTKDNYVNNDQLKIKTIGNFPKDIPSIYNSQRSLALYQDFSSEMQKRARSEMIYVKNLFDKNNIHKYTNLSKLFKKELISLNVDNKKYIEPILDEKYNVNALLFRSATLSFEGVIKLDNGNYSLGSSLAAPKIARVAYELKKKFPFLRYNQIKQILLTTAKRDNSGYLSNFVGWGYLDKDKALKGISDLNAGLIEEEKFFVGIHDRIYDEKNNIYAYFDIDSGEYTFSNDITSGLKGDGNTNESLIVKTLGSYGKDTKIQEYSLRLPKVLDSERNYYANVKKAGLRKDGSGTLILEGKQDYERTQILNGTLILKNDSKSKYEVFEKANFKIAKNDLKIENNVINSGEVEFLNNASLKEYYSNNNSKTTVKHNIKIKADKFHSLGKLHVDFNGSEKKLSELVESSDIKVSGVDNKYLKELKFEDDKLIVLKEVSDRYLKDLDKATLRNIPSYNVNENTFFKEYLSNSGVSNNFENELLSINSQVHTQEIFPDVYSSYISNLFEINEDILNNVRNKNNMNIQKENAIYFNSYLSTQVFDNGLFTPFKSNVIGNTLGYERKINDKISIDSYLGIYNSNLKFNKKDNMRNDNYQLGLSLKYIDKISFEEYLTYSNVKTKVNRKLDTEDIRSEFNSHLLTNTFCVYKKIDINDKVKIKPELNYTLMYLNLGDIKENSKTLIKYEMKDNHIIKNILGFSLEFENIFNDKFKLRNKVSYNNFLNNELKLKTKMDNVEFDTVGKKIEKHIFRYNIEGEYKIIDNLRLNLNLSMRNLDKIGLSSTIKYEF